MTEKYQRIINRNPGVVFNVTAYVNESIQGISIPGISDITITQQQHSSNDIVRMNRTADSPLGRINVEPKREQTYYHAGNPLDEISKEFRVTMRQNQGLLNYWIMYETVFHRICKPELYDKGDDVFYIDLLADMGEPTSRIYIYQPHITAIDGLEFSYSKQERENNTFDVTFSFNNINFDMIDHK
ncbi:MAG: hypothetical protein IIZ78_06085 [Clostridiales bacterium]|nr:hypothetical protein [Clostridiales bacterium]